MKKIGIIILLSALFLWFATPWSASVGIIALLSFMFFSVTDWESRPRLFQGVAITLVALIGLYIVGPRIAPQPWSICFQRTVVPETLKTPCETSAQFPYGEKTLTADTIAWDTNTIPTYFMDDKLAFNWYLPADPNREHLPYNMILARTIQGGPHQHVAITSSFAGLTATSDGVNTTIQKNKETTLYFSEQKMYQLRISGAHIRDASDSLHVSGINNSFLYILFHAIKNIGYAILCLLIIRCAYLQVIRLPHEQRYMAVGIAGILAILYLLPSEQFGVLALALFFAWCGRRKNMLLPILLFAILIALSFARSFIPYEHVYINYGIPFLTILAIICSTFFRQQKISIVVIALLLLNSFIFISHTHPYGSLVLFTGGNDELTHEGFARLALTGQTWRDKLIAGENYAFYYQPLYRYMLAGMHALWGESMFGPYVVQTFLTSIAFFTTLRFLRIFNIRYLPALFAVLFILTNYVYYVSLFTLSQGAFQQSIALPLLIICWIATLSMIYKKPSAQFGILLGLAWGVVYATRTDFLPSLPIVFCITAYATWKQRILPSWILGLSIAPILVIARNIIIAHQAVFMPTSGLINLTSEFTPLFPNTTAQELQSLGYGDLLKHVYATYHNNISALCIAIWHNLREKFIGIIPPRIVLWYISPVTVVLALLLKPSKQIAVILLFVLLFFLILIPNIFFDQHNGVAMFGFYDYILLLFCAIAGSKLLYILKI
ncbi:MAG: hypothetical protein K8Q97_00230 [Candidatus Andersenbacteria bacterium]|nr:hypothetical protein [Candidatus Andersenbacteria bacterium]